MKQTTNNKEGARGIQSIEVSGRILRALADNNKPMMLKDLANTANITPAQCHAYLTSLKNIGLVNQDSASGLYNIGSFAMCLAISWVNSSPLAQETIRHLEALSSEMGHMTLVTVWGHFGATVIDIGTSPTTANMNLRPGSLLSATNSASGRVFATYGNPELTTPIIESELSQTRYDNTTGRTLTSEDYYAQVEEIRKLGYSTANGSPIPGTNAIAAPVFDANGELALVITLIGDQSELSIVEGAPAISRLTALATSLSHSKYL